MLLIWLNVFLKHLMLISFTLQNFMYDVKPRKIKNNLISIIIHIIPQCNQTLKSDWSLIGWLIFYNNCSDSYSSCKANHRFTLICCNTFCFNSNNLHGACMADAPHDLNLITYMKAPEMSGAVYLTYGRSLQCHYSVNQFWWKSSGWTESQFNMNFFHKCSITLNIPINIKIDMTFFIK